MADPIIKAKYAGKNISQLCDDYRRLHGELNIHDQCHVAPEDQELKVAEIEYVSALIKFLRSRAGGESLIGVIRP